MTSGLALIIARQEMFSLLIDTMPLMIIGAIQELTNEQLQLRKSLIWFNENEFVINTGKKIS